MEQTNKILLFLTFALIFSSVIYLIGQKQETEIELDISNALINDLVQPRYLDGTYKSQWGWNNTNYLPKYELIKDCNEFFQNECIQPTLLSNQSLNGTTHIKIRVPVNLADIILAYTTR